MSDKAITREGLASALKGQMSVMAKTVAELAGEEASKPLPRARASEQELLDGVKTWIDNMADVVSRYEAQGK